jgi:DNA-binding NtrC family response regulator
MIDRTKTSRILIVDDEEHIVLMLKKALESETVAITCATDVDLALELYDEKSFDIVITDIMMPRIRGTHLLAELKKRDPFVQVIAITGFPTIETIAAMLAGGLSDFLVKPFKFDELKELVADGLKRSRRWHDVRSLWHDQQQNKTE